jgi:putative hydrolase of the HAD superfamily
MQMASVLLAPPDDFVKWWFDTFNERGIGVFQSTEANIESICRKLAVPLEDAKIKIAAKISFDCTARSMTPRPNALEVLSHLKSQGYKTGLISDCSPEIPGVFKSMPFAPFVDVAVFSCLLGITKPDSRIYHLAAEQLAVKPEACLYIGDGDSHELAGAAQAGMHPVLIRDPDEDSTDVHRVDAEAEQWDGSVITSLKEVLTLVD